jgi:hypothetical protein
MANERSEISYGSCFVLECDFYDQLEVCATMLLNQRVNL